MVQIAHPNVGFNLWFFKDSNCHNLSLGLATKVKACKVAGQEGGRESHHMLSGVQKVQRV
jgi:hypothetical protein